MIQPAVKHHWLSRVFQLMKSSMVIINNNATHSNTSINTNNRKPIAADTATAATMTIAGKTGKNPLRLLHGMSNFMCGHANTTVH